MVDPVDIHRIAGAALFGGGIILFGAGYAILHALSRLSGSARLAGVSLLSYAALAGCVAGLTVLLNLWGAWLVLIVLMLLGYFAAPRFIWRLSEEVHEADQTPEGAHGG